MRPETLSRNIIRPCAHSWHPLCLGLTAFFCLSWAPVSFAQAEADFWTLYFDWRTKQVADYNLDGLVNYWDVLCLSYHWAGVTQRRFYMAGGGTGTPVEIVLPEFGDTGGLPFNTVVARPPIDIVRPDLGQTGGLARNTVVAKPPVDIVRPDLGQTGGLARNTVVAKPPVDIVRPDLGQTGGLPRNTVVAKPPVDIVRPDLAKPGGLPRNTVVAKPPDIVRPDLAKPAAAAQYRVSPTAGQHPSRHVRQAGRRRGRAAARRPTVSNAFSERRRRRA
ncbi:hypothetical protein HS125_10620 [bacterium]|nr:hypothetical protein [bacterium]